MIQSTESDLDIYMHQISPPLWQFAKYFMTYITLLYYKPEKKKEYVYIGFKR